LDMNRLYRVETFVSIGMAVICFGLTFVASDNLLESALKFLTAAGIAASVVIFYDSFRRQQPKRRVR
jgi:hypothetical protein